MEGWMLMKYLAEEGERVWRRRGRGRPEETHTWLHLGSRKQLIFIIPNLNMAGPGTAVVSGQTKAPSPARPGTPGTPGTFGGRMFKCVPFPSVRSPVL